MKKNLLQIWRISIAKRAVDSNVEGVGEGGGARIRPGRSSLTVRSCT
jgi:hypothetical protein